MLIEMSVSPLQWLWNQHSVSYSKLPSYFLAFDILEKKTNKFLASKQVKAMMAGSPISVVPTLFEGILKQGETIKFQPISQSTPPNQIPQIAHNFCNLWSPNQSLEQMLLKGFTSD